MIRGRFPVKKAMRYYPIFADIVKRPCVVVGGGEVAERKVESLFSAGAAVTVVSPKVTKRLKALEKEGVITIIKRKYKKGDLKGAFLAVSAADSKAANVGVYEEATELGILVNVVDDPPHCNFIVPSVVDRGSLLIAISTSGKSPYLAKTLRLELEKTIGVEYETFIEILGQVRNKLLKNGANNVKKERVIKALVTSRIPVWLKENSTREINGLLTKLLGPGSSLARLGIRISPKKKTGKSEKRTTGE